jgi:hypothetical protein
MMTTQLRQSNTTQKGKRLAAVGMGWMEFEFTPLALHVSAF